jgi:hypothetical protein
MKINSIIQNRGGKREGRIGFVRTGQVGLDYFDFPAEIGLEQIVSGQFTLQ